MFKYISLCFLVVFGVQAADGRINLSQKQACASLLTSDKSCLLICKIKPEGLKVVRNYPDLEVLNIFLKDDATSDRVAAHYQYSFIQMGCDDEVILAEDKVSLRLSSKTVGEIVNASEDHIVQLTAKLDAESTGALLDKFKKNQEEQDKNRPILEKISGLLQHTFDDLFE